MSKLEPMVQLRNFPSVEEIQDGEERAECGVLLPSEEITKAKHADTFYASDSRQSRPLRTEPVLKIINIGFVMMVGKGYLKNYNLNCSYNQPFSSKNLKRFWRFSGMSALVFPCNLSSSPTVPFIPCTI